MRCLSGDEWMQSAVERSKSLPIYHPVAPPDSWERPSGQRASWCCERPRNQSMAAKPPLAVVTRSFDLCCCYREGCLFPNFCTRDMDLGESDGKIKKKREKKSWWDDGFKDQNGTRRDCQGFHKSTEAAAWKFTFFARQPAAVALESIILTSDCVSFKRLKSSDMVCLLNVIN